LPRQVTSWGIPTLTESSVAMAATPFLMTNPDPFGEGPGRAYFSAWRWRW